MSKPTTACTCTLCGKPTTEDATHLELYVIGSEGITVCINCKLVLTKLAEGIMHIAGASRMAGYQEGLKNARAYDAANPKPKDVTDYASRYPSP